MKELKRIIDHLEKAKTGLLYTDREKINAREWAHMTVALDELIWKLEDKVKETEGRLVPMRKDLYEL